VRFPSTRSPDGPTGLGAPQAGQARDSRDRSGPSALGEGAYLLGSAYTAPRIARVPARARPASGRARRCPASILPRRRRRPAGAAAALIVFADRDQLAERERAHQQEVRHTRRVRGPEAPARLCRGGKAGRSKVRVRPAASSPALPTADSGARRQRRGAPLLARKDYVTPRTASGMVVAASRSPPGDAVTPFQEGRPHACLVHGICR
jgi:hypothetical protein